MIAMLIVGKTADFRTKIVTKGREGYFIMIKQSLNQEDKLIINKQIIKQTT
jgi:hypothetical protein